MSRPLTRSLAAALLVGGVLSLGCQTNVYRSETVLHDDGSVDRAVYQPDNDAFPEAARKDALWKQTTYAPNPDALKKMNFMGAISELPIQKPKNEGVPYYAGWNSFKSAKDVPEHYLKKAPPKSDLPDAKLVRDYARTDYGLVTEHRWSETLTDIVTLDGMRKARDELADLAIVLFADTFQEAYGKDWDGSGLVKWLRDEARPWWAEMTDYVYTYCLNHKETGGEGLKEGLRAICARHGLVLKAQKEGAEKGDEPNWALADFALTVLCKTVKSKKDGKPLNPYTAMLWLEDLGRDAEPKEAGQKPGVFNAALKKVVEAKYGGKDAASEQVTFLVARILGLHFPDAIFQPAKFEYTMTVPGDVIETNGELLAANKVKWEFPVELAYPQGYTMTVRSLTVDEELRKQLFKDDTLKDVKSRQRYAYTMKWGPEGLRQAMAECRKQKSLAPLEAYRKKAGSQEQEWLQQLDKVFQKPIPAELK